MDYRGKQKIYIFFSVRFGLVPEVALMKSACQLYSAVLLNLEITAVPHTVKFHYILSNSIMIIFIFTYFILLLV